MHGNGADVPASRQAELVSSRDRHGSSLLHSTTHQEGDDHTPFANQGWPHEDKGLPKAPCNTAHIYTDGAAEAFILITENQPNTHATRAWVTWHQLETDKNYILAEFCKRKKSSTGRLSPPETHWPISIIVVSTRTPLPRVHSKQVDEFLALNGREFQPVVYVDMCNSCQVTGSQWELNWEARSQRAVSTTSRLPSLTTEACLWQAAWRRTRGTSELHVR